MAQSRGRSMVEAQADERMKPRPVHSVHLSVRCTEADLPHVGRSTIRRVLQEAGA
jgi:hypothetical protein